MAMAYNATTSRRLLLTLFAGAALAAPLNAMAQQASPAASAPSTVGEVVVTAQKRVQRVLDVPISISAVTATDIASRGVTSLQDINYAVPGLNITEYGVGAEKIEIRGISEQLGAPTVGVYIDEVGINGLAAGGGLDVRLIDMERIEVLRGPQPTLYGEDSMGGTIRYITASPNLSHFSGHIEGEVGGVDGGSAEGRVDGWVNVPIINDVLGVRIAAGHEDLGGWIKSSFTGQDNINDTTIDTLRVKALFKPTNRLTFSLLALNQRSLQNSQNYSGAVGEPTETSNAEFLQPLHETYNLLNFVASYDFGPVTLLSTTGYLQTKGLSQYDQSQYLIPIYNFYFPGYFPANERAGFVQYGGETKRTEELRLTSNGAGRLTYSVGGVVTDDRSGGSDQETDLPVASPLQFFTAPFSWAESQNWAVFGQVGYSFTDALKIDLGGRYFQDHETLLGRSATFDTFNPRVDVTYKTGPDGIVYFNWAKGFRSGGFNNPAYQLIEPTLFQPTFAPEDLYSYEIGTKQQLLDRRLTIEASAYYNEWNNIQAIVPIAIGELITNSGKATGPGGDVTISGKVTPELTVTATVGYTDVKYAADSSDRHKGDPLDLVAPWTWSVAADYTHPYANNISFFAHGDYGHTDRSYVILRNFGTPVNPVDARDVLNAKLGVNYKAYQGYIFADNLTDDTGSIYPAVGTAYEPVRPRPRVIGVGLKADF